MLKSGDTLSTTQKVSNTNTTLKSGVVLGKAPSTTTTNNKNTTKNTTKTKANLLTTIASTSADVGTNIGKGFLYGTEGLVDLGRYGVAGVADLLGNEEYATDVRERAQQNTTADLTRAADEMYNKNSALKEDGVIETLSKGVGYIGSMVGSGGLLGGASTIGVGSKLATTGAVSKLPTIAQKVISGINISTPSLISAAGSGMTQAYNSGADDTQATIYGLSKGLVEGLVEGFGGQTGLVGTTFGKGITDALKDTLVSKVTSKVGKALTTLGFEAVTEGMEDVISDFIDPYLQRATYNKDAENATVEQLAETFLQSAALSALVSGPSSIAQIKASARQEMEDKIKGVETDLNTNTQTTPVINNIPVKTIPTKTKEVKPTSILETKADTSQVNELKKSLESTLQEYNKVKDTKDYESIAFYENKVASLEAKIKEVQGIEKKLLLNKQKLRRNYQLLNLL